MRMQYKKTNAKVFSEEKNAKEQTPRTPEGWFYKQNGNQRKILVLRLYLQTPGFSDKVGTRETNHHPEQAIIINNSTSRPT